MPRKTDHEPDPQGTGRTTGEPAPAASVPKPRRAPSGRSQSRRSRPADPKPSEPVTDGSEPAPAVQWPRGIRWPLATGEVLLIESSADVFRKRVHADLTFATGRVFTGDGKPVLTTAGKPLRITAFQQRDGKTTVIDPEAGKLAKVLWEGTIAVSDSRLAYEISPDRVINAETGCRTITVSTIDANGNVRSMPLSVAVSRKQGVTEWLDPLGIVAVESPAMVGKYLRALADGLSDPGSSLYGQGPVYLPDGTLILAAKSGCIDTAGQPVSGWNVDLNTLNPAYLREMHDVDPQPDPETVKAGIGRLLELLAMSETYPEVPAAHVGQLLSSVLSPIDSKFFTVIWLHAKGGKGKTRFEALISAIQSPTLRELTQVKPELNLGDVTGTTKGPKYRVPAFGLGSILGDDIFKAIHSALIKAQRTEMADALIRSYEGGAAAIGTVDKARNIVSSKASGQLCTSIRFTAEEAPPSKAGVDSSTADRMIVQGGWVCEWHEVFDRDTFARLSESAALNAMYAAYSDAVMHVWTHQTDMAELYDEASLITAGWDMGSERVRSRYTPAVAGLLVLRDRAVKHGYPATCVDAAISALEAAAVRQTAPENTADLSDEFRRELRLALRDGAVCATGRPVRSIGEDQGAYISPYLVKPNPDDEDAPVWEWPNGVEHPSDLGLRMDGANARPKRDSAVELFVRPPKPTKQGGRNKTTEHQWSLITPTSNGTFEALCRVLTARRAKTDELEFEPEAVIAAVTAGDPEETGGPVKTRIRYYAKPADNGVGIEDQSANPAMCILIPTAWLFAEDNETEN